MSKAYQESKISDLHKKEREEVFDKCTCKVELALCLILDKIEWVCIIYDKIRDYEDSN